MVEQPAPTVARGGRGRRDGIAEQAVRARELVERDDRIFRRLGWLALGDQAFADCGRVAGAPPGGDALFKAAELEEAVAQRVEQHERRRTRGERRAGLQPQLLAQRRQREAHSPSVWRRPVSGRLRTA